MSTWNSNTCTYVYKLLTTRGMQALFVVNYFKLHLTALIFNYFNYCILCSILNESIPKDEADQLLQDLFHEMSM